MSTKMKTMLEHPFFLFLGIVGSAIAIFTFITGIQSIRGLSIETATLTPFASTSDSTTLLQNELSRNPIIPSIGIAGIVLGDTYEFVVKHLGNPVSPLSYANETSDCCIYNYWSTDDVYLYISFTISERKAVVIQLQTYNNPQYYEYIPYVNNVSIGSSEEDLLYWWGSPINKTEGTIGCPGEKPSIGYFYTGISFLICKESKLINSIGIR